MFAILNIRRVIVRIIQLYKLITIPHRVKELDEVLVLDDDSGGVVVGMEAQALSIT